jgi:hypothetical protein
MKITPILPPDAAVGLGEFFAAHLIATAELDPAWYLAVSDLVIAAVVASTRVPVCASEAWERLIDTLDRHHNDLYPTLAAAHPPFAATIESWPPRLRREILFLAREAVNQPDEP